MRGNHSMYYRDKPWLFPTKFHPDKLHKNVFIEVELSGVEK